MLTCFAIYERLMIPIAIPSVSSTPTPTTITVLALFQAISFNTPLMRVKVEPLAATPFVIATAVYVAR
jgi:hypothetical protein